MSLDPELREVFRRSAADTRARIDSAHVERRLTELYESRRRRVPLAVPLAAAALLIGAFVWIARPDGTERIRTVNPTIPPTVEVGPSSTEETASTASSTAPTTAAPATSVSVSTTAAPAISVSVSTTAASLAPSTSARAVDPADTSPTSTSGPTLPGIPVTSLPSPQPPVEAPGTTLPTTSPATVPTTAAATTTVSTTAGGDPGIRPSAQCSTGNRAALELATLDYAGPNTGWGDRLYDLVNEQDGPYYFLAWDPGYPLEAIARIRLGVPVTAVEILLRQDPFTDVSGTIDVTVGAFQGTVALSGKDGWRRLALPPGTEVSEFTLTRNAELENVMEVLVCVQA